MSQVVLPTVGRSVHFWENAEQRANGIQPQAATITYVWGPNVVNVTVFHANGSVGGYSSVLLVQPGQDPPDCPEKFCMWPERIPEPESSKPIPVATDPPVNTEQVKTGPQSGDSPVRSDPAPSDASAAPSAGAA